MKLGILHTDTPEHQALSAAIKACNAMENQNNMQPIRDLLKKIPPSSEINQWLRDNQAFLNEPETQQLITQQAKKLERTLSTLGEKALAILGIKPIEKDNTDPNTTLLLELISMMDDTHRTSFLNKSNLDVTPKELSNFNAMDYKELLSHLKSNTKSGIKAPDTQERTTTSTPTKPISDTHEERSEEDDTQNKEERDNFRPHNH